MRRVLALAALLFVGATGAAEVSVAVAANFTAPMQKIAQAFSADTGHKATLVFGATGALQTQVRNGAPFQVLLAADDETPQRLAKDGFAVAGTSFTYATGRLVLWSAQPDFVDGKGEVLARGEFQRIAIANPKLAPYGAAAVETMNRLRLRELLQPRIVQGENIAQAYQFVATGNAALGFVALSQVMEDGRITRGSAWIVPASLHQPLRQDAVLLAAGRDNAAAAALVAYLKSGKALSIIRSYGYEN